MRRDPWTDDADRFPPVHRQRMTLHVRNTSIGTIRPDPWTDDAYGDESLQTFLNGSYVASILLRAIAAILARLIGILAARAASR